MSAHELEQADILSDYLDALESDDAPRPLQLDRETTGFVRRVHAMLAAPAPDPAFLGQLGRRLERESSSLRAREPGRRLSGHGAPLRRFSGAMAAALAVALISVLAIVTFNGGTQTVSAREVLERASAASARLEFRPFAMVETVDARAGNAALWADRLPGLSGNETIRGTTVRRFESATRWRVEESLAAYAASGQEVARFERVAVADGASLWVLDPVANSVTVRDIDTASYLGPVFPYSGGALDLRVVLSEAATCHNPELTGRESAGGRDAYVIDLGASSCARAAGSLAPLQGRRVLWIDAETSMVLRVDQYSGADGALLSRTVATEVEIGPAAGVGQFSFTPPAGARVQDLRAGTGMDSGEFLGALQRAGTDAGFRVFVPALLPAGLLPTRPQVDPLDGQLRLVYAAQPGGPVNPRDVEVRQGRATYDLLVASTEGAGVIATPGGTVWLRPGAFDAASGTGLATAAMILRDGTFVTVQGLDRSPEELVRVALSLQAIPGALPAAPAPEPRTLAQLRREAPYRIFVPSSVPGGLAAEHPFVRAESSGFGTTEIHYRDAEGRTVLVIRNGSPDCCSGIGSASGRTVTLADGTAATALTESYLGEERLVLSWREKGTLILLASSVLPEAKLVEIAATMSDTADTGQTGLPPRLASP